MRNTLSFIPLKGHKERVRTAAVVWSLKFTYAVDHPTLYTHSSQASCEKTPTVCNVYCKYCKAVVKNLPFPAEI